MKYNVTASNAYNDVIQVFKEVNETTFNSFLHEYMEPTEFGDYFLKGQELPEYGIPFAAQGWLIKFTAIPDPDPVPAIFTIRENYFGFSLYCPRFPDLTRSNITPASLHRNMVEITEAVNNEYGLAVLFEVE